MTFSEAENRAMRRALALAASPGVPPGPNPRVGCVLLDDAGREVATGFHRGAGTPHAEAEALASAGERARGATAVVTLEPCDHTGRTPPCSAALVTAGVRRVVYAQPDVSPVARGGAETLRAAGVEVAGGLLAEEARALNRAWTFAAQHGRPFVTWKLAASLDGRSAAADGTSRWISSTAARADAHRLRATCDVVLVGTGTVRADDPQLTVRDADGVAARRQPLRAVMGTSEVRADRRVLDDEAETLVLATRDPGEALACLHGRERRHVLLEGGPTLAAAFWRSGLVDEVVAYLAPVLLGAGAPAIGDLGIATITDADRLAVGDVQVLPGEDGEDNLRLTLHPRRAGRETTRDTGRH